MKRAAVPTPSTYVAASAAKETGTLQAPASLTTAPPPVSTRMQHRLRSAK